jgi:DNA-binding transcriptional ArsR family regulator
MDTRRDVFQAIADPTRRQIIEMIAREPLNLNRIAGNFEMSRQAISLHVKILEECGLILINKQGRERFCEAKLDELTEVTDWVVHCRSFWKEKFSSLDTYLKKNQPLKKKKK